MLRRSRTVKAAGGAIVAILGVFALGGSASAHVASEVNITCSSVSGTITDTATPNDNDHPITWNVKVGDASFQVVASTETPLTPGPNESTRVTADISALTATLNGTTATVSAFASWPSGQSDVFSSPLTCGTAPAVVSPPVAASPQTVEVSPAVAERAAAPAAVPVAVAPRFTG